MAALSWKHFIAGRELALDQEALSMSGARPQNDLDAARINIIIVESVIVTLLQL